MNSSTTAVETLQDRGPAVLAVTAALLVISTIFVGLRLISRIGIVKKVTWDDHFIVLAWVRALSPESRDRVCVCVSIMTKTS